GEETAWRQFAELYHPSPPLASTSSGGAECPVRPLPGRRSPARRLLSDALRIREKALFRRISPVFSTRKRAPDPDGLAVFHGRGDVSFALQLLQAGQRLQFGQPRQRLR